MKRLFISSRISCYKTVMAAVFVASFVILLVANYGVGLPFNTTQQNYQTSQGPEPKGAGYFYSAKRIPITNELANEERISSSGKAVTQGSFTHKNITQKNIAKAVERKRQWFASQDQLGVSMDNWQAMGPFNVGGRSRAMVFSPADSDIIYSAGVSGGVFKSFDSGQSWQAISNDLENMAVVTLAISQQQPDMIYAGTGEGHYVGRPITRSRGVEGNGIFVSTDAGISWSALASTLNNSDFRFVNKLRITPANMLIAATGTGLWRSADSGASWQLVLDQRQRVGGCLEVEIKPGDANVMLASCGSFYESAVFRSVDGGNSWTEILSYPDMGRALIAFSQSQPETVYIVAAQNESGDIPHALQGLYRSNDSGASWDLVTDVNSPNPLNRLLLSNPISAYFCPDEEFNSNGIYGQGWYSNSLSVDPVDPERIWVGTLDLMRSDDGGANFGLASYWWGRYLDPQQGEVLADSYVHADQHKLLFHPDYDGVTEQRIYSLNDGGIYVTDMPNDELSVNPCDANSTPIQWQSLNGGYAVNQFYHGAVSTDGTMLVGGMQDNGTYLLDINTDPSRWRPLSSGDGGYAAFDPTNANELYISSQFANVSRFNLQTNERVNVEAGIEEFRPFITPFIVDPNRGERLFLSASSLWRSDNRGEEWIQVSTPNYENVVLDWLSAIAVQPSNPDSVLVGGSDGYLYQHDSATFADNTYEMPRQRLSQGYISSLSYHPFDSNSVYATVSTFGETHIHYSSDNGVSWTGIDGLAGGENEAAFPDIPAHDVIKSPEDDVTLYVGSDLGVYVSRDNGNSWAPLGAGFPNTPVERLVLIRNNLQSSLFAFTYGRGAFKLDMTDVPNIAPEARDIDYSATIDTGVTLTYDFSDAFIDRNLDEVSVSAKQLPAGVTLDAAVLTVTFDEAGEYGITITGSDGSLSADLSFTITVEESPSPPPSALEAPDNSSGGGSSWHLSLMLAIILITKWGQSLRYRTLTYKVIKSDG